MKKPIDVILFQRLCYCGRRSKAKKEKIHAGFLFFSPLPTPPRRDREKKAGVSQLRPEIKSINMKTIKTTIKGTVFFTLLILSTKINVKNEKTSHKIAAM